MSFAKTEIQTMVADSLGRLLAEKNAFEDRRRRLGGPQPDRLALWAAMAELGVIGTVLPEEKGGFGGSMRDIAVVMSALGASLAVEPYLAATMAARILQAAPTDIAEAPLASLISGELVPAFVQEPGFDPFATPSLAVASAGNGWTVSGICPIVRHAELAQSFILAARLENGPEIGCFLVDADASGVAVAPFRLIDAAAGGEVAFTAAAATLLVSGTAATNALADAIETGIVGLAAEAVGIMRALNAATFAYLGTRKQFGVTLANFQALQHRAADMHIAAEEAEILTDRLLTIFEAPQGAERSAMVSAVKALIDTAGRRVSHEAVQMHGGMGVSDELNVSHYLRRLAAIRAQLGDAATHRARFLALAS